MTKPKPGLSFGRPLTREEMKAAGLSSRCFIYTSRADGTIRFLKTNLKGEIHGINNDSPEADKARAILEALWNKKERTESQTR